MPCAKFSVELVWKYGRLPSVSFLKSSIPFHSGTFHIPFQNFPFIPFHFHSIPCPGFFTTIQAAGSLNKQRSKILAVLQQMHPEFSVLHVLSSLALFYCRKTALLSCDLRRSLENPSCRTVLSKIVLLGQFKFFQTKHNAMSHVYVTLP